MLVCGVRRNNEPMEKFIALPVEDGLLLISVVRVRAKPIKSASKINIMNLQVLQQMQTYICSPMFPLGG